MKKVFYALFIFAVILYSGTAFSQKVAKGSMYAAHKFYDPSIVGEDSKNIYVYSGQKNYYLLEAYDKNKLKKLYSIELKDSEKTGKGNPARVKNVVYCKDKFLVFYDIFVKNGKTDKEYSLYVKTFSAKSGKELSKRKDLITIPVEKKSRRGRFSVKVSEDESKILISHGAYYGKLKKYLRKYILLDNDLNKLYESGIDEDQKSKYASIIDNDGSFYTLSYNPEKKSLSVDSYDANKDYEKWSEKVDLPIKPGSVYLNSVSFNINANNDFVFTGLYSAKKTMRKKSGKIKKAGYYNLKGTFYVSISSESKEIKYNKVKEFDSKFLSQFEIKSKSGKTKRTKPWEGNQNFEGVRTIDLADGGVITIGEQKYYQLLVDANGTVRGEIYVNGDLLAIKFDKEGNFVWGKRVPKSQKYISQYGLFYLFTFTSNGTKLGIPSPWMVTKYFSYYAGIHDGKLKIIFNDHIKNSTVKESDNERRKDFKKPKKAAPHQYEIDLATGKSTDKINPGLLDPSVILVPSTYYQKTSDSPSYIFGQKKGKYKFMKFDN